MSVKPPVPPDFSPDTFFRPLHRMPETEPLPASQRKRKWTRASLRGLLIVFAGLGVVIGFWTNAERRQRRAAAEIVAVGGTVTYENRFFPEWLAERTGIHYFHTATEVSVSGFSWSSEQKKGFDLVRLVAAMEELPSCRTLAIRSGGMDDDDLEKLQPLADQIEDLVLREVYPSELRGRGLAHIKNWSRLKSLFFGCDFYDGKGISQLATCPRLTSVSFNVDRFSKENFDHLACCENLETISLSNCSFKGKGMQTLRGLPKLKWISFSNCSPYPYVSSYRIGEDGPIGEPTFDYRGGDPQFVPTPILFDDGIPSQDYKQWKKKTLPGVEIIEEFHS